MNNTEPLSEERILERMKELEGHSIIRTKPVLSRRNLSHELDYGFITVPIELIHVTASHLVYREYDPFKMPPKKEDLMILGPEYIDDNWISYDELIDTAVIKLVEKYPEVAGTINESRTPLDRSIRELIFRKETSPIIIDSSNIVLPLSMYEESKQARRQMLLDNILKDNDKKLFPEDNTIQSEDNVERPVEKPHRGRKKGTRNKPKN